MKNSGKMKKIYMDHAASTPVDPEVMEAMKPYFSEKFGNPSSFHGFGREASEALEKSRKNIAGFLGVDTSEIVFTSGGTESDNLAIKGVALANKDKGKHVITSKIEHEAVLSTCKSLEKQGFQVTYLDVDKQGLVDPENLRKVIRKDTILVSVMYANNEIGTIEPIDEIGKICREKKVYFHTDAVQAFGRIPLKIDNVDLLSVSSHKIYGPKGVGMLYVRKGLRIDPIVYGGGHEKGRRSGTENVSGIVGFAKAVELAKRIMNEEAERQSKLRNKLIDGILEISNSHLNGHPEKRLPNNVNVYFDYVEGESLILRLDEKGVAASTGSACSSKSLEPSHILLALGLSPIQAHGSLRLTLGKMNTESDVDYVLEVLPEIVKDLREISPLNKEVLEKEKFEEHEHE